MHLKLSAGCVILFIALLLQFWFASAGIFLNLSFVALIVFAFIFGFWELLTLVLLTVFIINWQPVASVEILVFALYPIAVHLSRNISQWHLWVVVPAAIVLGFLVLYGAGATAPLLSYERPFLLDLGAGLAFGALIFFPLYRWGNV